MWQLETYSTELRQLKNIYIGETRIATQLGFNAAGTDYKKQNTYYYHSDHLGSAQLISDCQGKEYERIEYTPYGETWIEKTRDGLETLPFRFTGKELDEETGFYYYGARYLNPKTSVWISADPALGEYVSGNDSSGGVFNTINLNLYHYAGNNPISYIDPNGRDDLYYDDTGNYLKTVTSETTNVYMTKGESNTLIGSQSDYEMMTAALYGESTENLDEMQAIGDVIMNRAEYSGTSASSEITAAGQVNGYNSGSINTTSDNRTSNTNSKLVTARQAAMTTILGTSRGKSNGAYYWDGSDIASNSHKTSWGIHYTDSSHDIYGTGDSLLGPFQEHWQPSGKNRGDPWDHKLDSTAAYGGTIFWKLNDTYRKATGSKEFRR